MFSFLNVYAMHKDRKVIKFSFTLDKFSFFIVLNEENDFLLNVSYKYLQFVISKFSFFNNTITFNLEEN